jgi:hypothetical protein
VNRTLPRVREAPGCEHPRELTTDPCLPQGRHAIPSGRGTCCEQWLAHRRLAGASIR